MSEHPRSESDAVRIDAGPVRRLLGAASSLLAFLLALPIRFYRRFLSPLLPPACRYEPSCSRYALEALAVHGPFRGIWLAVRRLSRCHPFGGMGFDPVPPPHVRKAPERTGSRA